MVLKTKYLFLYNVEKSLRDKDKSYASRALILLSAWDQLFVFLRTCNVEDVEEVVEDAFRFTFRFVLSGDWYKLPSNVQGRFAPSIRKCMPLASKLSYQAVKRCETLLAELAEPWMQPVLQNILRGISVTDEQVSSFLSKEGSELLIIRLEVLCEENCGDFALRLVERTIKNIEAIGNKAQSEVNTLKDMYFSLLALNNRTCDIIHEISKIELCDGLNLVRRWYSKRHSCDSKMSHGDSEPEITNDDVCSIIANTVLTAAMLQNVEEESKQHLLYELIKEWLMMLVKNGASLAVLTESIRKVLVPAESSIHIYMFCLVLKEFDYRYRSLCVEIFIRGLTFNMNEVELFKINADTENVLRSEARLSNGYLQLADVLKEKLLICRECVLTAFSLHPTLYSLNLIYELAYLSQKTQERAHSVFSNSSSKKKSDFNKSYMYNGKVKSGECLNLKPLFKKSLSGKLLDAVNVSPIDIFDSDSLELAPQLCDDLTTVLNGPRNLTLSWTLEWSLLKSKCVTYLEEYTRRYNIEMTSETDMDVCASDDDGFNKKEEKSDSCSSSCKKKGNDSSCNKSDSAVGVSQMSIKPKVDITTLHGKELTRYLSNLNLNPRVVLTRTTLNEAASNKPKSSSSDGGNPPADKDEAQPPRSSSTSLMLAQSISGLTSLDTIIPETQEPTIQVVQISNNNSSAGQSSVNTECQTVSTSDHSFKNAPIYSQPCNAPFMSSDSIKESCSDVYVTSVPNSSQTLNKEKMNMSGWPQISRLSSEHSVISEAESENNSVGDKLSPYLSNPAGSASSTVQGEESSSAEGSRIINSNVIDDKLPKSFLENDDEAKDKQKKNPKFEFESREVNIGSVKNKSHSFIVKPKINPSQTKEDSSKVSSSGSILRVIVRDCKNSDQFLPIESRNDSNKTELLKITNSGVINSYSCPEQLFKLISKKDTKQEIGQSASLPNFQHVFGRQSYQAQSETSEENVSISNCHIPTSQETPKEGRATNAISKAIQTVSKDQVESEKCTSGNLYSMPSSNPCSNAVASTATETCSKSIVSDQPSSSLILAYKIPVSSNSVVQLKSTSVLKKSGPELCTKTLKSDSSQTVNAKESVIRSSMNFLLSATLKNPVNSVSNNTTPSNSVATFSKTLVSDKKVGDNNPCQLKTKVSINIKKTIKKGAVGGVQRVMKPVGQSSVMNNICQTDPPVVSIQVPLKSVQVIPSELNSPDSAISQANSSSQSVNLPEASARSNSIASSPVEPSVVSSTTLEQLREFESVLEHITNTSQMKEKSTIQERLDEHSIRSPAETLTMESKTSNFVNALSVVESSTATSSCTTNNKTSNSGTSTNNLLNTPKMSASTSVVLVSRPVVSPALSGSSQSPVSPIPLNSASTGCKMNPKITKSKTKAVSKTTSPTSTLKVSNLPKPQQKPQEDEQTTQRIYAILDKYAEQLRNSPELKNKPAPRRRSNPPSNPSHSTKRKKSSHSKPKSNINLPSSSLDLSPASEDIQTLGSEDSSNGVSQLSQTLNSPQNADDITTTSLGDFSSEMAESSDKESHPKHQIVITDALQNPSGRTVIVQDNIQQSVINVDNSKLISGKQVVVGGTNSVPVALLPAGGNVKQVIFPVSSDCRPLVVATKVPKMYRVVTTGGVPSGSPILSTGSSTVLLRQMCLNKASPGINLKPLKVPVMSSANVSNLTPQAVVLPTTAQTIPITSTNFSETFGVSLDSAIMLNSHSTNSVSLISNKRLNKVVSESNIKSSASANNDVSASLSSVSSEAKVESVIVSCQDPVVGKLSPAIEKDLSCSKISISNTPVMFQEHSSHKLPNIEMPKRITGKTWSQAFSSPQKEDYNLKGQTKDETYDDKKLVSVDQLEFEKHTSKNSTKKFIVDDDLKIRKDSFSVICTNESVIKSGFYSENSSQKPSCDSSNSEGICTKMKTDFLSKTVDVDTCNKEESDGSSLFSQSQDIKKKCVNPEGPIFNVTLKRFDKSKSSNFKLTDSMQNRLTSDKELNLQKSLSEECEDLGVDKPSTSDLFPEAELILEPDPLSRESTPVEVFSRSLESSSSSHDSPSRSPIFSGKLGSSPWFKHNASKKSQTKKPKFNNSLAKLQSNNMSDDSMAKLKNHDASSNQNISSSSRNSSAMSNDLPFNSNFGSSSSSMSSKLCDIVDSKSDSWSDDHDLCNFTELDESLDSFAEDDSDINATSKIKSFPDMASELLNIANSTLSSDSSEVSLRECFNISDTGDSISMSCQKNGVDAPINTDSDGNIEVNASEMNCLRKRKSLSPLKFDCDQKLQKLKKALLDTSDDSISSSDAALMDSSSCDREHITSASRRSSSRGLIKKGCPCFSNSSASRIKKKMQADSNLKSDKVMYPSQSQFSLSIPGKKSSTIKQLKTNSKKR